MLETLAGPLGRLAALGKSVADDPSPQQLEELRGACAAAVAAAGPSPGAVQQSQLWRAAAELWNASLMALGPPATPAGEAAADADTAAAAAAATDPSDEAGWRAVAALRQAASDVAAPLAADSLLPPDRANLLRFHLKAGEAWASLGQLEAAEAALSRGSEAAAALLPLAFEPRGRGPQHQEAAQLCFELLLQRLGVGLRLGQEVLVGGLLGQARALAADERLPAAEGTSCRILLIRLLRAHGERLAKAGQFQLAVQLLEAAYETLAGLSLEGEEGGEMGRLAAEARATGAQVLTLLAHCSVEAGMPDIALHCVQALKELADQPGGGGQGAQTVAEHYMSLRALLLLGRLGEAEAELLTLVGLEDAGPEACLGGLRAALATPGGVQMARAVLDSVLGRWGDEPALGVDIVEAALQAASAASTGGQAAASEAVDATEAAEALALELAGDDRLVEGAREDPKLLLHLALSLWNHATGLLHASAFEHALAFFSAAAPLLASGSGSVPQTANGSSAAASLPAASDCCRAQALCCLGCGQPDRALSFLEAAEGAAPGSVLTVMLRLTAQLAAGSEDGAADAVQALAACEAAHPDALRIACVECIERGAPATARQALEALLARCAAARQDGGAVEAALRAPGYEATVFMNLLNLLLEAPGAAPESGDDGAARAAAASSSHSSELARLFDALLERLRAVGPQDFLALDDQSEGRPGAKRAEWLALQAWNAGLQAGTAGDIQQASVLMAVCGELYAAVPLPGLATLHKQKMAFLMAAACAADVAQQERAAGQPDASSITLARSYVQQGRAAAVALAAAQQQAGDTGPGAPAADPKSDVYLLLLDFKLGCLAGDVGAQLEALERCRALPAFGADQFARVAAMARAGSGSSGGGGSEGDPALAAGAGGAAAAGRACAEVCRAAEAARLQRLTQQAPLDYPAAAAALRTLLELSPADSDRLALLEEAAGLLSAAPPGAYPQQELRWLVTAAWNRGAFHARFGRAAEAARFMRWAAAALAHDAGLAEQYGDLMRQELATATQQGGVPSLDESGSGDSDAMAV